MAQPRGKGDSETHGNGLLGSIPVHPVSVVRGGLWVPGTRVVQRREGAMGVVDAFFVASRGPAAAYRGTSSPFSCVSRNRPWPVALINRGFRQGVSGRHEAAGTFSTHAAADAEA